MATGPKHIQLNIKTYAWHDTLYKV